MVRAQDCGRSAGSSQFVPEPGGAEGPAGRAEGGAGLALGLGALAQTEAPENSVPLISRPSWFRGE